MTVAVQGEAGSNSDTAVQQMLPGARMLPFDSFEAAFDAVTTGVADRALIPVENSSAGRVADPHHLLPHSGLSIIGEHFLPIHFDLVAVPGTRIEDVRAVRSHVHAFGQATRLLTEHGFTKLISSDTAGAAREVAALGDPSIAALGPSGVAERFGLEVLADHVEDAANNATRFLLLAPEPHPTAQRPAITTVIYRVRNLPAALYKCLGGFATNGVNITKLESYQLGGTFFASQFYMDIDGHADDRSVQLALEELRFFVADLAILGTYPAHPYREQLRRDAEAAMRAEAKDAEQKGAEAKDAGRP